MNDFSENMECPICLTEIQTTAILDCSHVFCKECLLQHLTQKITCPLCRNPSKTYRCEYMIYDVMIPIPLSIQQMLITERNTLSPSPSPPSPVPTAPPTFPVDPYAVEQGEFRRTVYLNRAARVYMYVSSGLAICIMIFQLVVLINILVVSYHVFCYYEII